MNIKYVVALLSVMLSGCAGALGKIDAVDSTERGLSYVACAIVTAAIIGLFR
ncbi:hypothetical protein SAMN05216316_1087 [Nitrosovibrio sp. Nv6]|nr:hypothetical protein SAMN05216316_1087 [Nitrosovibrio sp. Nv6]